MQKAFLGELNDKKKFYLAINILSFIILSSIDRLCFNYQY